MIVKRVTLELEFVPIDNSDLHTVAVYSPVTEQREIIGTARLDENGQPVAYWFMGCPDERPRQVEKTQT